VLLLWTALFGRDMVGLRAGASAWRQAPWGCCPLALSLPSLEAGGWGQTRATGAPPRGAWATPPQARSTTPPGAWSACS